MVILHVLATLQGRFTRVCKSFEVFGDTKKEALGHLREWKNTKQDAGWVIEKLEIKTQEE